VSSVTSNLKDMLRSGTGVQSAPDAHYASGSVYGEVALLVNGILDLTVGAFITVHRA